MVYIPKSFMVWNCHFQSIVNEGESGKHGTAIIMNPGVRRTRAGRIRTAQKLTIRKPFARKLLSKKDNLFHSFISKVFQNFL